jgi:LytS/YehU family sensor histidine kinase
MVYETNEDKVLLEREIRHLKNFIEVYQLRIAEEDDVIMNFDIIGDIHSVKICPMLLIPFVENAIKHGINPQEKSEIHILIEIIEQTLYFKVTNLIVRVTNGIVDNSSGFGLANLKTRLAILYPNTHSIETTTENGIFIAQLSLKLN